MALYWFGLPRIRRLLAPDFAFAPLADPPGFRRLAAGDLSRGIDPFVGLGDDQAAPVGAARGLRDGLCRALFGVTGVPDGVVPIASFSDYRCPYCRILTQKLAVLEKESRGAVDVTWHEWPLLGATSEMAAKAALAAARQDAYAAFHEKLMGGAFVPTPAYLADLAGRSGIDPDRLIADMNSPGVAAEIEQSRALAALFRFPGTPALVVGRTVVAGAIGDAEIARLVEREREEGPPPGCRRLG